MCCHSIDHQRDDSGRMSIHFHYFILKFTRWQLHPVGDPMAVTV